MKTPVKDSLEVFTEGARVNFKMHGFVASIFGVHLKGQEPKLMPVVFNNAEDKENFRSSILRMIASGLLQEFVFVAECWAAKISDPSELTKYYSEYETLENYPGREEVVQVLYCSPSEEICYTALIDRGTMTLRDWEKTVSSAYSLPEFTSRFQGLFAKGNSENN